MILQPFTTPHLRRLASTASEPSIDAPPFNSVDCDSCAGACLSLKTNDNAAATASITGARKVGRNPENLKASLASPCRQNDRSCVR